MTSETMHTTSPVARDVTEPTQTEVPAPQTVATPETGLPATRLVQAPMGPRRVAWVLTTAFLVLIVALALLPWQQNVSGAGDLIAFAPQDRQQTLGAPIKGVVLRWFVAEGALLKAGDKVVEMADNDPNLFERLTTQRESAEQQRASYADKVKSIQAQIRNLQQGLTAAGSAAQAKVSQEEQKLRATRRKLEAAQAKEETARLNIDRTRALRTDGLVSQRELEVAILKATESRTEREAAQADMIGAAESLAAARATLNKALADQNSKIEDTNAKLNAARAELAGVEAKLADMDVKLARQAQRVVRSPMDGVLLSALALPGAQQVKQGDALGVIVPSEGNRAAALVVDGNDAAIVSPGRKVRLQFEGWPAVQFAGWPSVAVGTFGGKVAFVDSASDGKGNFRVVVMPDPDDVPWPEQRFLRLGARTKGWILLDEVRLGYELWRRFNGFPPAIEAPKKDDGPGEVVKRKSAK